MRRRAVVPRAVTVVVAVGERQQLEPSPSSAEFRALVSVGQLSLLYSGRTMPVSASVSVSFRPLEVASGLASIRFSRAAIFFEPCAGSWSVDLR